MTVMAENPPILVPHVSGVTKAEGLATGPVSVEPYRSPEFYERERRQVFGRAWLNMGRIEQLAKANSYFVKPVEACKATVLVTRDAAGTVRAFHNVCTHRGNAVAKDECGQRNRFTCRYHGWTFRNDGVLFGVPDEAQFFDFDRKDYGLKSIACELWDGWIFINFQKIPEVTLAEYLGDLGRVFTGIPYLNTHQALIMEARLDANWKLIADAFAETYHLKTTHPQTLAPSFTSEKNRLGRPVGGRTWGIHRSVSTYGNMDYVTPETSKVERLANLHAGTNVLAGDTTEEVMRLRNHPAINPAGSEHWSADLTWLFPNFHIDYSSGGFWTHEFWPTAHNKTRWVARIYIPTATSWRDRLAQEHYAARWGEVLLEDISNCESIQTGIESGAIDEFVLQDAEFMIRHSLQTLDTWMNAETARDAISANRQSGTS